MDTNRATAKALEFILVVIRYLLMFGLMPNNRRTTRLIISIRNSRERFINVINS